MTTIKFYSVVRRQSVEVDISKVELVVMKNGRPAAQAIDPETGGKMFKILGAADKALITDFQAKNPKK
ncbi:hypothetical protein FDZ74_13915 [bacterium]|nr:MAG: hypothetical protein FDZ74_13915 [bacterium]